MLEIRKQLGQMEDVEIDCGPVGAASPDETVKIKWMGRGESGTGSAGGVNAGVKSQVDGRPMDGVTSVRIAPQAIF